MTTQQEHKAKAEELLVFLTDMRKQAKDLLSKQVAIKTSELDTITNTFGLIIGEAQIHATLATIPDKVGSA